MLESVLCKIRGHDWKQRPVVRSMDVDEVVGTCGRCGREATRWEAAAYRANGRGPPGELLDQPPESEIIALYRDGKIDEKEMEYLLDKTLSESQREEP